MLYTKCEDCAYENGCSLKEDTDDLRGCAGHGKRKEPITAETFMDIPLTPEESIFVKEIAADLLIRKRAVPDESDLLKEILYRAMLVSGSEVPEH